MVEIENWETFDTILNTMFSTFTENRQTLKIDFEIDLDFKDKFDNFDILEEKVRYFFSNSGNSVTEIFISEKKPNVSSFYFQYTDKQNLPFEISITNESSRTIQFKPLESVSYNSSDYFLQCLHRAYERFTKLTNSENEKIGYPFFKHREMEKTMFFNEAVQEFCIVENITHRIHSQTDNLYKYTIIRPNSQDCLLTISNIGSSPMILFEKTASSAESKDDNGDKGNNDIPVAHPVDEDGLLQHIAQDLKQEFDTFSKNFPPSLNKTIQQLLTLNRWFQNSEEPLAWKENYETIEKVRVQFEKKIAMINKSRRPPVNPELLEPELQDQDKLRAKLKRWFKKLLELHFGLRARQLRSRNKYKIFYEHRITNAIAEHIMDEPGVNEAFAHFQSLLRQCGAF